jgi:ferredoxin
VAVFDAGYCREDCRRCTQVCPSGAIVRLSLEAKRKAVIGLARVELDLCRLSDNRECDLCHRHCPFDAVSFAWNEAAYCRSPVIDPTRCTGCGACAVVCPGPDDARPPRRAITIVLPSATL